MTLSRGNATRTAQMKSTKGWSRGTEDGRDGIVSLRWIQKNGSKTDPPSRPSNKYRQDEVEETLKRVEMLELRSSGKNVDDN